MPRIALLVGSYRRYRRHVLYGIARYAQAHGPWHFAHQDEPVEGRLPPWLAAESWDAAVVRIDGEALCEPFRRLEMPIVDVAGLDVYDGIGCVTFDGEAAGTMAAEHLIECGLEHFAFYGVPDVRYSDDSLRGFSNQVGHSGRTVRSYLCRWRPERIHATFRETLGLRPDADLTQWIASLPKPVGLFACNDFRAYEVLEACRALGLAVPEDMAVIGLGNDEVLCELNATPLTSVDPNAQRVGYDAAAWIDSVLGGRGVPCSPQLTDPLGVVARRSTDILYLDDELVAKAVRFIRRSVHIPLRVEDVCEHVGLTRRTLERRFVTELGRTPSEEVGRVRLKRLVSLLVTTSFSAAELARAVGFNHAESASRFFKSQTGLTMGEFRAAHRPPSVAPRNAPTSFSALAPSRDPGVGGPDGLDGLSMTDE